MARRTPVTVEQPFSRMHSRSRLHHLPAINPSTTPTNQSTNQAINQSTNHSQHTTYTLSILSCRVVLTFVTLLFNPLIRFSEKNNFPPRDHPGRSHPLLGAPHPGWSSGRPETQCSPPSNTDYLVTRAKDRIIYGTETRRVWMSCWTLEVIGSMDCNL